MAVICFVGFRLKTGRDKLDAGVNYCVIVGVQYVEPLLQIILYYPLWEYLISNNNKSSNYM